MRSLHVPYHRVPKGLTRAHTQTYTHVSDGTLERYDACGLNTKHRNMHVHGERLGHEEAEKTQAEEDGVMLDPDDCATIGKVMGVIPADEVSSIPGLGQDLLEVRLGDEARGNVDDETVLSHYIMPYM